MQIRLLGEVSATDDDGRPIDIGPTKSQAVLAALALSAGEAVAVDRLIAMVWGDHAPRTADKTLQSYVTRLRKGLGPDSIERKGAAYRLDIPPDRVDARRFERHLAEGRVRAALEEWMGEPLAGLEADGLGPTIDRLTEQWLAAVEADLEHTVGVDPASTVSHLTQLTADHPFREGLWALLMTALYRSGRQADALAAFGRARHILVEELGIEPGPRLRELEAAILDQDASLLAGVGPQVAGLSAASDADGDADAARAASGPKAPAQGPTTIDGGRVADGGVPTGTVTLACIGAGVPAGPEVGAGHPWRVNGVSGLAFDRADDAVAWAQATEESNGIGLHTGEAEAYEGGYYGAAVAVAAAVAAAAHPGQTVASATTAALLEAERHPVSTTSLGRFRVDDSGADLELFQVGPGKFPAPILAPKQRGNLPRRHASLHGRATELAAVGEAVEQHRLITLVGPGGIGKTSLAIAAAEHIERNRLPSGGVWFAGLAALTTPGAVPRAVADALGVTDRRGHTITESTVDVLQRRPTMLVIDNAEHVIEGVADTARVLLENCPELALLVTSREPLGLIGERIVPVGPLRTADGGVALFAERAVAADPSFDTAEHEATMAEICTRLDGVPLAIELAAARTRTMTPDEVRNRLDDQLRLLAGGRRTADERHRTMRATIDWSYQLLEPAEQSLLSQLSVFAGSFDLRAAEAVGRLSLDGDGHGDRHQRNTHEQPFLDEVLHVLAERSMIQVESGAYGRRFRLLETVRQFAADDRDERVDDRHHGWCLSAVREVAAMIAGPEERRGVTALEELWADLRRAVYRACDEGSPAKARALIEPIVTEVYVRNRSEIGDWCERMLAATTPDDDELILFGVTWAARRYMRHQDRAGFERLMETYRPPDDPMLAYARGVLTDDQALRYRSAQPALASQRSTGDQYKADLFELAAAIPTLFMSGEAAEGERRLVLLLDRLQAEGGPPTAINWGLVLLGMATAYQGKADDARRHYTAASEVEVVPGTSSFSPIIEARMASARGGHTRALWILRTFIEDMLDVGDLYGIKLALPDMAVVLNGLGARVEAMRVVGFMRQTKILEMPSARHAISPITAGADLDDPSLAAAEAEGAGYDERALMEHLQTVFDRLLEERRTG